MSGFQFIWGSALSRVSELSIRYKKYINICVAVSFQMRFAVYDNGKARADFRVEMSKFLRLGSVRGRAPTAARVMSAFCAGTREMLPPRQNH